MTIKRNHMIWSRLDPSWAWSPLANYLHGWGDVWLGARPTKCSWTLTVSETQGKSTFLGFDRVTGTSLLIFGNDIRKYCNTYNLKGQPYLRIQRPDDESDRYWCTCVVPEDNRSRIYITRHPLYAKRNLLGNFHTTTSRKPLDFGKFVHCYKQAPLIKRKCFTKELPWLIQNLKDPWPYYTLLVNFAQKWSYSSN